MCRISQIQKKGNRVFNCKDITHITIFHIVNMKYYIIDSMNLDMYKIQICKSLSEFYTYLRH